MALVQGRGRTAIPVRSALAALVVGVAAVCAALTFAFSLDRLVTTPALRGWNWDYVVGNYADPESAAEGAALLRANPDVEAFSGFVEAAGKADDVEVEVGFVTTEDGVVSAPVLEGRHPADSGEIAVGRGTLEALGKEIGDEIEVLVENSPPMRMEIVGTVIPPVTAGASDMTLDDGLVATWDVINETLPPDVAATVAPSGFLVRLDERSGPGAVDKLQEDFPGTVLSPVSTVDIESVRVIDDLPYLLAVVAALLGFGTLTHTLVTAVRRRRRDLATLRALGFSGRQIRATVGWQALAFTAVALVIGIPLGVAGRQGRLVARGRRHRLHRRSRHPASSPGGRVARSGRARLPRRRRPWLARFAGPRGHRTARRVTTDARSRASLRRRTCRRGRGGGPRAPR